MKRERIRGGWVVVALAMLFVMPVVIGSALFFSGWRPAAYIAHGTLVQPPRPLAGLGEFRGRWTLLYAGPAECPTGCRLSLHKLRQVHLALGRDGGRVQRVFAARGMMSSGEAEGLARAFPGTALVGGQTMAVPGGISLVDPLGNVVMSYGDDADAGGIRKDMARLLAYSWVG